MPGDLPAGDVAESGTASVCADFVKQLVDVFAVFLGCIRKKHKFGQKFNADSPAQFMPDPSSRVLESVQARLLFGITPHDGNIYLGMTEIRAHRDAGDGDESHPPVFHVVQQDPADFVLNLVRHSLGSA
jgi:hypothetical protein